MRVRFGRGARRSLDRELDVLSLSRAFVLTTPQQVREGEDIVQTLGSHAVGLFANALRTDLPQIVLPSTYAGSEATPVLGQTENGVKTTLRSERVQPEVIIYEPELIATLPVAMTVTSELNAMAHAVEGLYAHDANRLSSALAVEGIRAFVSGLPRGGRGA